MKPHNPHDALFKHVFLDKEVAAAQFRALLPKGVANRLDFDKMSIEDSLFVDEKLKSGQSDLLYRVPLKAGGVAFIWVLFEHQSKSDRFMALRVLEYMVFAWKRWRSIHPKATHLPVILPLVLQHDPGGWRAPTQFSDLYDGPVQLVEGLKGLIPDFEFILDDLTAQSDGQIMSRAGSDLLKLLLLTLKGRGDIDPQHEAVIVAVFEALDRAGKLAVAEAILTYTVNVAQQEPPLALSAARKAGENLRRITVSYADTLIEKGQARGRADVLLKQISLKFGEADSETVGRIRRASEAQIDTWIARILVAETVETMLGSED